MSFLTEIEQQSKALNKILEYYINNEGKDILSKAASMINKSNSRAIIFLGMGTSCITPQIIRDLLINKSKFLPLIYNAGEFLHYAIDSVTDKDVVIAISQSGESIETRKCVEQLKEHKYLITITNNENSTMAKLSRLNLPMLAGSEESISNKTYSNLMAILLMLGYSIINESTEKLVNNLKRCAEEMKIFNMKRKGEIKKAAEFLKRGNALHFIARGPTVVAAEQASLTWMEGIRINTTAFTGGGFRHGPFEMVGANHKAIFYAPEGEGGALIEKTAREISGLGSKVLVFSGRNMKSSNNMMVIQVKPEEELTFSVATAVPQELLLAQMAEDKGLVPGKFLRIDKITKVE